MNAVNAEYGNDPGTKSYSSVNDRYALFASRLIPVTASEAPYILSGLPANEAGRQVRQQYADTAGYTHHVFGKSSLLDRRLVLHVRDLPSKRFYVFDPAAPPTELRKLVAGQVRENIIVANWPDLFSACIDIGKNDAAFGVAGNRGGQPVQFATRGEYILAAQSLDRALPHGFALAHAFYQVKVAVAPCDSLYDVHASFASTE